MWKGYNFALHYHHILVTSVCASLFVCSSLLILSAVFSFSFNVSTVLGLSICLLIQSVSKFDEWRSSGSRKQCDLFKGIQCEFGMCTNVFRKIITLIKKKRRRRKRGRCKLQTICTVCVCLQSSYWWWWWVYIRRIFTQHKGNIGWCSCWISLVGRFTHSTSKFNWNETSWKFTQWTELKGKKTTFYFIERNICCERERDIATAKKKSKRTTTTMMMILVLWVSSRTSINWNVLLTRFIENRCWND